MAVTATVVGYASGNTDTFVIPITTNVPRTTPTVLSLVCLYGSTVIFGPDSVSDDALPQDDYSFCLFANGLNNYNRFNYPNSGGIANELLAGTNSITVVMPSVQTWGQIVAINFVGAGPTGGSGVSPLLPADMAGFFPNAQTDFPAGSGMDASFGVSWDYFPDNPGDSNPRILQPLLATDGGWGWINGDLAVYPLCGAVDSGPIGGWTWSDGSITDFFQVVDEFDGSDYHSMAIGTGPCSSPGPSLAGVWGTSDHGHGSGEGGGFRAGSGPGVCNPTPPTVSTPSFDNHFRAVD